MGTILKIKNSYVQMFQFIHVSLIIGFYDIFEHKDSFNGLHYAKTGYSIVHNAKTYKI